MKDCCKGCICCAFTGQLCQDWRLDHMWPQPWIQVRRTGATRVATYQLFNLYVLQLPNESWDQLRWGRGSVRLVVIGSVTVIVFGVKCRSDQQEHRREGASILWEPGPSFSWAVLKRMRIRTIVMEFCSRSCRFICKYRGRLLRRLFTNPGSYVNSMGTGSQF